MHHSGLEEVLQMSGTPAGHGAVAIVSDVFDAALVVLAVCFLDGAEAG